MVTITCQICGKQFRVDNHRAKTAKACSFACAGKLKTKNAPKVAHTCLNCGKEFYVLPSQLKYRDPKYCSQKCHGEANQGPNSHTWNSIEVPCDCCGKMIQFPPNRIDRAKNHFCDMTCYAKWQIENRTGENNPVWRGGYAPYYGNNWINRRREAVDRDGHCCRSCGISEEEYGQQLDVHHIIPLRLFDGDYESANQLSNLISLCAACHKKIEFGKLPLPD